MNGKNKPQPEVEVIDRGKTYITSKGVALHLQGVSPLLIAKLQSVGVLPDVPTRKMMLDFGEDGADGSYQLETLSEGDLQTAEEEAQWKAYVKERDAVLTKRNDGFLKAIFAKGVEVDLSRLDSWKIDLEYFGIPFPEHPLDQKVDFIQMEAIANTEDMVEVITGVLGQSGVGEEELADVKAMFRGSIRRNTAGKIIDAEIEVDLEPDLHGDAGRPLLGLVAAE